MPNRLISPAACAFVTGLLMATVSGCSTWSAQGVQPAIILERERPATVRITRHDSSTVELAGPYIEADSLKGTAVDMPASIALSDVAYISVRRGNKGPVLVVIGLAATGLMIYGLATSLE